MENEPTPSPADLRILALGDSYTIGESVTEAERWPTQLAARLRKLGLPVKPPQIVARTGWTTGDLIAGISAAGLDGPFDLVTLLIGVNNQYRGLSPDQYRQEFREILKRAVDYAGGRTERAIVVSIPDWGITPFAEGSDRRRITTEIDAYNAINRAEAASARVPYVDVTPISRMTAGDAAYLAEDKLHPSGKMYAAWVDLLMPQALTALRS
jgi:lysophospholipase L1-like esterase